MEDYYKIMGVSRNASEEELRSAYRRLAKQWHPDVCNELDAHQRFIKIGEAYEILRDPRTRQQYDYMRANQQSGYAGQQSHSTTYSETAQDFSRAQYTARQQAESQAYRPLEELLAMLLKAGVQVGRVAWKGEAAVREEVLSFGTRMAIGFKGSLLLLMVILTFAGVAAPFTVPIGFLIYKSLTHNKRFIGIGNLLSSTILFLIIAVVVIVLLFAMFNPFS